MKRVRELREEREISQTRLAEMTGLTQATVSNLEHGRHDPNLKTLYKIAEALDVHPTALLEESDPKDEAPEAAPAERLRASLRALPSNDLRSLFLGAIALDSGLWVAGTAQRDLAWLKSFAADHEVEPAAVLKALCELWPDLRALRQRYAQQARQASEEVDEALSNEAV